MENINESVINNSKENFGNKTINIIKYNDFELNNFS